MVYRFVTYLHTRARMCIAFMCIACTRTQIDRIWNTGQQPAKPISLTDFRSSVSTQDGQCKSRVFGTPTQNVFRSTTKIAKICNESAASSVRTQNEFRLFDQMAVHFGADIFVGNVSIVRWKCLCVWSVICNEAAQLDHLRQHCLFNLSNTHVILFYCIS